MSREVRAGKRVNRHSTMTHYQRPTVTQLQEGGTGGEVSEILFFSAKSKRRPSLIYSMQIIPVCLSIVARRKGVSATRRGGLNWTPISLLVGHPCKLFHREAVDPEAIKEIERRFDACCEQAITFHESQPPLTPPSKRKKRGRRERRIEHNLALRFNALKAAVLLFPNDLIVPFTNNEAERDLRMTKVRQMISGCFRTEEGAENFCIL